MGMFVRLYNVSLILVIVLLGTFVLLTGRKEFFGYRLLTVRSGSMEPKISTGSLILISKAEKYDSGDIVAYGSLIRKNALITHRIIDKTVINGKVLFVLKGDANKQVDTELIPTSAIAGKYRGGVPFAGYPVEFAQTPPGLIVLIVLPGTIIVLDEIRHIKQRLAKPNKINPTEPEV